MSSKLNQHGLRAAVLFFSSGLLIACTGTDEIDKTYMNAPSIKPIVIPDGLATPNYKNHMVIPQEEVADNGIIPEKLQIPPPLENVVELELDEESAKKTTSGKPESSRQILISRMLKQPDGLESLEVDAAVDAVWPLVGEAFTFHGYTINDANRGRLIYSVSREYEKFKQREDPRKFEWDGSIPKEQYLIYLLEKDNKTEVTLRNEDGKIDGSALARQLLVQLKNYLLDPTKKPLASIKKP